MLSDEEKKAIEYLKQNNIVEIQYDNYGLESIHRVGIDEKQTILNLIEKQSKEIEDLKDFNIKLQATKDRLDNYDKENTLEIEKLKKEIEELKEDNKELKKYYATRKEVEELREINACLHDSADDYIHKDKIKEKIKELERDMVLPKTRQVLKELLEE